MPDKVKKFDRRRGVAPTCVHVSAASQDARNVATEERVMPPLHRRVQEAAKTVWSGESVAVAISDILGPHARKEWDLPVGSHRNPFWRITRKVSSPHEMKTMLSKSLILSCSLGSPQLVKNLLDAGADPTCDSGQWGPVHSAAYGGNVEVMRVLLEDPRTSVDTVEKKGHTALHLAALKGNCEIMKVLLEMTKVDVNAADEAGCTALHVAGTSSLLGEVPMNRFLHCISLLMDRSDLEMNKPDKDGLTALSHTIMFSRKDMTQAMLRHRRGCHMNLDTFLASYYGRSIREAIQHTFPELMPELPEPFQEKLDSPIAAKQLLSSLQTGDFSRFQSLLKSHSVNLIHWYDEPYHFTIIEIACQLKNREGFVKELLKAGANPNTVNPITSQSLLHLTAKRGNIKLLQILLHAQGINVNVKDSYGRTPLHCLAGVHCRSKTESDFLQKSLGLLLGESDPANNTTPVADLHAVTSTGDTALHIATRMGDRQTVLALLRHGANLMHKVSRIGPPLSYIDPSVMENFLDECIDSSDESSVQQDYMLTFDYNFLNPIKGSDEKQQYCVPEMPPLKYLASKYKFKHLLKHPIITSFLTLKWRKIRFMYFTNFVFYSLFLSVLTWYSFITSGDKDEDNERIGNEKKIDNESLKQTGNDSNGDSIERLVALTVLSILLALLVLREAFQFLMSPKVYLKHHNNWLLWVIIATTLNVCLGNAVNVFPKCMALSLLLAWTQFVSFLGGFPFLSIQLEMLKTVAWTSFIFLVCYCPLFFAFGISFYIMFRNSGSSEDEFFSSSFGMSMLKVFIMFAGEFEASDIPFEVTPYTSHLVFTVFVFLISIVLLNLLNGLAVSDAQAIRNDAEILSLSSRVKLISYIEKTSSGRIQFFSVLKNLPDKKLRVFPNRKEGRVEVNGTVVQNTFLDQEIVQQAISIANNKKKMSQENENESEKQLQKELTDIEKCHLYMRKELNEIKVKLDSLDKANKETQNKLNEILTLVLQSYGSHTSHK